MTASSLFALLCSLLPACQESSDLVQSVEQVRGGRHWIDQPTDPPKSPDESADCFEIEPGYRIQLVACEPVVTDPVAIDFDDQGRLFVAEYTDYPVGPADPAAAPLSRIVLLEDSDADGHMDQRTVFADGIRFCHSLMAFRGGILACSDTEILFLRDTSGDNTADVREVWFDGFLPAHPQMQIGCPRYGFDHWIYLTYGHGKVRCTRPGFESAAPVDIPQGDFRFHPETMEFGPVAGAGQFGQTIDSFGHRFFSSNRNPIMTDQLTLEQVRRNPLAGIATGHRDVGASGEQTRVYPRVVMKSNWLSHAGTHTSACGVTAYRGGQFGPDSDRMVFVCEPVGHLVTRNLVEPEGAGLTSQRARETADFLTSTDTWFRPVSLSTGPDGALYLADMYRLWVEHPKFVPDDVAAKMDWRAGEDRGRIWRIVAEDSDSGADWSAPDSTESLCRLLSDSNGWRRMLAQRLLVERRAADTAAVVRRVFAGEAVPGTVPAPTESSAAFGRLHAMWVLFGLADLTPEDLKVALEDPSPTVRRDAARLVGLAFADDAHRQDQLAELCLDDVPEVQFHAILNLKPENSLARMRIAAAAAKAAATDDQWLQKACLIACPTFAADVLDSALNASRKPPTEFSDGTLAWLQKLALNAAGSDSPRQLARLCELIRRGQPGDLKWQTALVNGLAEGLPRHQMSDVPKSLAALLAAPLPELNESLHAVQLIVTNSAKTAVDRQQPDEVRIAAMQLIGHLPPEALSATLEQLLQAGESASCQRAGIEGARRSGRTELALLVLSRWEQIHPLARSAAVDLLLVRPESVKALLNAMETGAVPVSVISIDQRLLLLQHGDAALKSLAAKLFGGNVSSDRREVAEQYATALEQAGDAKRGAAIFEKTCSKCHRIGTTGNNVGPDISDTRARARDALLYDILDPNRRVDPQYSECVITTTDGRSFAGLLIADSGDAVTLRQPEGREQVVARSDIEELKTSAKSLMPEGIEKDVSVDQMADLLAFLKDR